MRISDWSSDVCSSDLDSLDAFGIHGIGGMIGAIGTGIVYAPWLGGPGGDDFSIGSQLVIQIQTVLATIVWSAVGNAIAIFVATALTGTRVPEETEDGQAVWRGGGV